MAPRTLRGTRCCYLEVCLLLASETSPSTVSTSCANWAHVQPTDIGRLDLYIGYFINKITDSSVGRNLKQCKDAIEALRAVPLMPTYPYQPHSQSLSLPSPTIASTGIKRKAPGTLESFSPASAPGRRLSGDPVITTRDIRPKPPTSNGSPLSMTSFPTSEPKKRGRPSKKDAERKQAEAIARGDIIPPITTTPLMSYASHGEDVGMSSYAPILPTPASMNHGYMYGPSPNTPIETKEGPESVVGSPGKKKRPKPLPKVLKVGK